MRNLIVGVLGLVLFSVAFVGNVLTLFGIIVESSPTVQSISVFGAAFSFSATLGSIAMVWDGYKELRRGR